MKSQSTKIEKGNVSNTNVSKEDVSKKKKSLDSLNLDSLKDSVLKSDISDKLKETKANQKNNMYKLDYNILSTDEQKKFRNSCRNKLNKFSNDILGKDRSDKERTNAIIGFLKFYKETYRINNFELSSLRSKISNETDKNNLLDMLSVVKTFLKENEIEF